MAPDVTYQLVYPHHHRACSSCHHLREGEPMIKRTALYGVVQQTVDLLCPYCIFEWEAASLIVKAYPRVYEMFRDGMYHRLRLVPQLELFTDVSVPHEI